MATLGFKNDKTEEKGNRKWLVDQTRFNILRELFSMFLAGNCSGTQLYEWAVNVAKLTTPIHKRSGGRPIAYSRIYEILKDPIYAGFFFQGGERYELAPELPRIITEAEHYKVRKMLGDRNIPKTQEHLTPFAGFIKSPYNDFIGPDVKLQIICECKHKFSYQNKDHCPKCNTALVKIKDPKYLYYCYYYNVSRRKQRLKVRSVEETYVTGYLVDYFDKNLHFSPALADWCRRSISELKDKELTTVLTLEEGRGQHVQQLIQRKERARQYLNDGITSPEDYKADAAKVDQELAELKTPLPRSDWAVKANEIVDLTETLVKVLSGKDVKEKRTILRKLGSNIIWNEEKLNIINTKPIQCLIDVLTLLQEQHPQFEPKNIVDVSDSNPVFRDVCPTLLRTWEDVRKSF